MPKLAILIPASATAAFYSQIAAISIALRNLNWQRWQVSTYAFVGEHGPDAEGLLKRWLPYLRDIEIVRVSQEAQMAQGNWAQCDATMRLAPRDADVLMSLDADTLPVRNFEEVLDEVLRTNSIAGLIAHYPVPPGVAPREEWQAMAAGLIDRPLDFAFRHSLVGPEGPETRRSAPFYLNGGVVLYSRPNFDLVAPRYLELRPKLAARMAAPDFSGQVALTLAAVDCGLRTRSLPMRYNFPNDPEAERLHPSEMDRIVIYHYLRLAQFNRHEIFATAAGYLKFLGLQLTGINKRFQVDVRTILGSEYPFPELT